MRNFHETVYKPMNTFKKNRYLIHCNISYDGTGKCTERELMLKGFNNSTLEQCLSNYVREEYIDYDYNFEIVTDIVNKLVILTVTITHYGFVSYTIDKIERISDIEED